MQQEFTDSIEFAVRRFVRTVIKKAKISKFERDIVLALANHWFHHYQKGVIYPGRNGIAKKAKCSVKTVSRTFDQLRKARALIVISRPNGEGQKPTVYKLNIINLLIFCGCNIPDTIGGELIEMSHHFSQKCLTTGGTQSPTVKDNVERSEKSFSNVKYLFGNGARS
jgi:hypothetical protein